MKTRIAGHCSHPFVRQSYVYSGRVVGRCNRRTRPCLRHQCHPRDTTGRRCQPAQWYVHRARAVVQGRQSVRIVRLWADGHWRRYCAVDVLWCQGLVGLPADAALSANVAGVGQTRGWGQRRRSCAHHQTSSSRLNACRSVKRNNICQGRKTTKRTQPNAQSIERQPAVLGTSANTLPSKAST